MAADPSAEEVVEITGRCECHRCGAGWNFKALMPPPQRLYTCCPFCGWLGEEPYLAGDSVISKATVIFDASSPSQRTAVGAPQLEDPE